MQQLKVVTCGVVADSGKVRTGGIAPTLPQTKDSGKVRTGGIAPALPRK